MEILEFALLGRIYINNYLMKLLDSVQLIVQKEVIINYKFILLRIAFIKSS